MKWVKIILLLLLPINCMAQVWGFLPYKNDAALSDKKGYPLDSFAYYFPVASFTDSVHWLDYFNPKSGLHMGMSVDGDCTPRAILVDELIHKYNAPVDSFSDYYEIKTDSFLLSWFSFDLYKMREPVLSNFFYGREIYRFTWLRSFDYPVMIKIEKTSEGCTITTKELAEQPLLPYEILAPEKFGEKKNSNISFIIDHSKRITDADFRSLTTLIDSVHLYALPSIVHHNCHGGNDGAEWILEVQKADGYYCAYRWSPNKNTPFNDVGQLMIKLSGLRHERIY
jgi:hypothetical protein